MTTEQKAVKIFALVLAGIICLSIVSAIFSGLSWIVDWNVYTNKKVDNSTQTVDSREIDRIDIDLGTTNIEIVSGSDFKIQKENLRANLDIKTSGTTLKIKEISHSIFNTRSSGKIIVYIPSHMDIKELDIDMGAGSLVMENIKATKLDLDHGAGTLEMDSCEFDKTDIDGGVGKTSITNSTFRDLDLNSGVGKIDIEAKLLGKTEIEGGVGSVDLTVRGNRDDYYLKIEKGIGSITVDGENVSGTIGTGSNLIDIEGGVGSIKVNFN